MTDVQKLQRELDLERHYVEFWQAVTERETDIARVEVATEKANEHRLRAAKIQQDIIATKAREMMAAGTAAWNGA